MAYYAAPFTFDFATSIIQVDDGVVAVDVIDLYDAVKEARASEEGILYDAIATGSGLVSLGDGVAVGLTVNLLGGWQTRFAPGSYIAKVSNGNLVGGPGGDPIAYSAGVQVLLLQSAASTVVTVSGSGGGSAPTATENAQAVWSYGLRSLSQAVPTAAQNADALLGRNLAGGSDGGRTVRDALRASRNKSAIEGGTLTIYQEDDATPAWTAAVNTEAREALQSIDPA